MSVDGFTVHCPLGRCHGAVKLRQGVGVYYVQAFRSDPETPLGYPDPDPAATVGGERFVDERRRRELLITCTDDHYLRLHLAPEGAVDAESCVYGPVSTSTVRCPACAFGFGEWSSFELRTTGPTDREHELRSVTGDAPEACAGVRRLSRSVMLEHDRFAHRRECPNCGHLLSFNYVRR